MYGYSSASEDEQNAIQGDELKRDEPDDIHTKVTDAALTESTSQKAYVPRSVSLIYHHALPPPLLCEPQP